MAKKKKSRFKGKTGANAQKQKQQGASYGHLMLPKGVNIFNDEPDTKVKLDILPYEVTDPKHPDRDDDKEIAQVGSLWYKRLFKLHRNVGINNDSAICPTSFGKKCPICEYRAKLLKEGASYKDETVKALRPSDRNLYIVVPIDNKDYDEKPHVWDMSQFLFQDKLNNELTDNEDYESFPDFEEGYTLKIRFGSHKIGEKGKPFATTDRIDFIERDGSYNEDEMLKKIPSLDDMLKVYTYKELEAKFFELDDEEAEPADEVVEDQEKEKQQESVERKKEPTLPVDWEDVDDYNTEDLHAISEHLDLDPEDYGTKKKLKVAIAEELEIKIPKTKSKAEKEQEEEKPKPKKEESKKDKDERCPYGHKFGVDCEEYADCDDCDEWSDCIDAKEGN